MNYLRLYADAAGESHFDQVAIEMHPVEYIAGKSPIDLSSAQPASAAIFGRMPAGWGGNAHPVPRRQLVVTLAGELDVTASDGEVRRIGPGIAWILEDTTGKGHRTRIVTDWSFVLVPLE